MYYDDLDEADYVDPWKKFEADDADDCASEPPTDKRWESPAEHDFAGTVWKYLNQSTEFGKGCNFTTRFGQAFRTDFLLGREGHRIAVEIDGREHHKDRAQDELRDAILIADHHVKTLYRFAAAKTHHEPFDCAYLLMKYEPSFFTPRARDFVLPRLVSRRVLNIETFPKNGIDLLEFDDHEQAISDWHEERIANGSDDPYGVPPEQQPFGLMVARFSIDEPKTARRVDWVERVYDACGPIPFPRLLEAYRKIRVA